MQLPCVWWLPTRVPLERLERWIVIDLRREDAVVLEMTTNTRAPVDTLTPYVHSVTVVHPPHVHLITRAQVMTDQKAALILARLHTWLPLACGYTFLLENGSLAARLRPAIARGATPAHSDHSSFDSLAQVIFFRPA
jgi:hypothetical protein